MTHTLEQTITEDDVRDALQRAVDEYGEDWVDPNSGPRPEVATNCVNVYQWDPSLGVIEDHSHPNPTEVRRCIAAHALHLVGVDDDTLLLENEHSVDSTIELLRDHDWSIRHGAQRLLEQAQALQDVGFTWGAAVQRTLAGDPRRPNEYPS